MALTILHHYNSSSTSTSTPSPSPSLGFLSLTKFTTSKINIGVAHSRFRRKVENVKMMSNNNNNNNMDGPPQYEADHEKAQIWNSISMEDWVRDSILPILKPIDKSWQPQQLLPDPASEGFLEQVKELRSRAKELPDDYFVVLVGDMITEEALPTYQARLTVCNGVMDESGADESPWVTWTRAWSAEENRHGDLLNKYLYLSGRVDMQQVEKTIQYLIASGMNVGVGTNPYCGMIYTAFQERATFISHANTAKLAMKHGDAKLAQICGTIASDEKRHESAYSKMVEKMLEVDPDGIMVAFGYMIRRKITMPAHLMYDGHDQNLFAHFTNIASRIGVYTAMDYVEILEHFLEKWNIANLTGLSAEGRRAQDYVCGLPLRYRKLQQRAHSTIIAKTDFLPFSWIFNRQVLA